MYVCIFCVGEEIALEFGDDRRTGNGGIWGSFNEKLAVSVQGMEDAII